MSHEGLGKKLQAAREARNLSLEDAGRMTKIRPARLAEIEAEDFSQFASLAYAKGFLLIYGKFLDVDVSSYLEAFETSNAVTVDGYSYLEDNPAPKPRREIIARPQSNKTSLMPLLIGVVVLVVGFAAIRLILDIQRIAPPRKPTAAIPTATPGRIVAPRALPAENEPTPAPTVVALALSPTPEATSTPNVSTPTPTEPEVRRAEPVHPEDLVKVQPEMAAAAQPAGGANRVVIRPLGKTYVRVMVDGSPEPMIERWITPGDGALEFEGRRMTIRVLDRGAVAIQKNGRVLADDDPDVTIE